MDELPNPIKLTGHENGTAECLMCRRKVSFREMFILFRSSTTDEFMPFCRACGEEIVLRLDLSYRVDQLVNRLFD